MNELEQKTFDEVTAANKLLLQMNKNQKRANKNMLIVSVTGFICLTAIIISMVVGFFVYESQFEVTEMIATEETVTTETTTYEQEVSGENSNINNVEGNQYNDNATHNE